MKRVIGSFFVLVFLFGVWVIPALAADPSAEIDQLKGEVNKLLQRIQDLEKKQTETETKAKEAEKKITEVEQRAVKVEKKSLKDRIELGGEARFRIVAPDNASVDKDFYGVGQPTKDTKIRDESSFPLRLRLNAHAEVVPDWVDLYARLTMNKRWGTMDPLKDPFNAPNSFFAAHGGADITPRFEQMYMTMKIPYVNSATWYVGRLPGMDGAPQRGERSLFPRLFIDSEIDGTLVKWNAPETALDEIDLPWTGRLWGKASEPGKAPALKQYEAKVNEKTGIILGYLKYFEEKLQKTDDLEKKADSDAFLAQAQLKIGKDTTVIWDGLTMADWHMPNGAAVKDSGGKNALDLETNYLLTGAYVDTQLFGLEVYGAYYYSHFDIPNFSFTPLGAGAVKKVGAQGFPGHILFGGFNTGDLIHPNHQLTVEFADGSEAWINPFNYRAFRRKGTVAQPADNLFFIDPSGKTADSGGKTLAGFYPFNARVWDLYYDYYAWRNVRFRLGYIDFLYTKHDIKAGDNFSILGSSRLQHEWWPYAEINISF